MKRMMNKYLLMAFVVMGMCMTSCKKEFELNETSVTLNHGDKYTIGYENGSNLVFTSDNPYVAMIDEGGVVTANFVGEATINVSASEGEQSLKVTVAPLYTTYEEPCLDFSMTKSEVKDMYKDSYLGVSVDGNSLFFDGEGSYAYQYSFIDGELQSVYVWCQYTSLEKVLVFLDERYPYVDESEGVYIYTNALDLGLGVMEYKGHPNFGYGVAVCYIPVDFSEETNSRSVAILKNGFGNMLNTAIAK